MATHSNILDWKIPWTGELGRLQFIEVAKSWTQLSEHTHTCMSWCIQNRHGSFATICYTSKVPKEYY